jgi:hypothetical protein
MWLVWWQTKMVKTLEGMQAQSFSWAAPTDQNARRSHFSVYLWSSLLLLSDSNGRQAWEFIPSRLKLCWS